MKKIFLILICLCLPLTSFSKNVEKMNMISGQTELLRDLKVDRISIGNPAVIDVQSLDKTNEILVQALNPGFSDLRLWKDGVMKQFIVEVVDVNIGENLKHIELALSGIEGITIHSIGNQVMIEGDVYRQQDINKIAVIVESFENVVSLVSKPNLDLRNIVSIDVKFVEISKNAIKNIGINWDDAFGFLNFGILRDIGTNDLFRLDGTAEFLDAGGDAFTPGLDLGSSSSRFLGISSRVDAVLNLLSTNGYAKILAEPNLSCVSGGQAEFLAGGQVPLPVFTDNQQSVDFRDYGVVLSIEPVADSFGNISTSIEFEISDIDPSVAVNGIPGFLTRSTSTEMNVRAGETIVLSGLYTSDSGKDVDKVAGLGDIPILGELFKSRNFRNEETELYVFLTPHLIDSQSNANFDALNRAEELESESEKELKIQLLD